MKESSHSQRPALSLLLNPDKPVGTGPADRGLGILMRQAITEIRACREVIGEAGLETPELQSCNGRLNALIKAIDGAAYALAIGDLLERTPPNHHTRHLHSVDSETS